jgi:GNAT superfamily N-acetyltransferase
MKAKVKNNYYHKVSQTEPEVLRRFLINEVGEKAKEKLYNYLKDLADSYPKFDEWFYDTVIPELELENGEREIIIVLSELEDFNQVLLTGIAILKNKKAEKKICTFRIHEDYRGQGIGTQLFEECFKYLDTRRPIITMSHDRKDMFKKHIKSFNFKETQILKDYYKKGSIEYVYNGTLK